MLNKGISLEKEYEKCCVKPEDIQRLREWLMTQHHLPHEHITDLDLLLAYYASDRSAEVTKQLLDVHCTLRSQFGFCRQLQYDNNLEQTANNVLLVFLPTPAEDGSTILYARLLNPDPKFFSLIDLVRIFIMSLEMCQYEQGAWQGLTFLMDMKNVGFGHLAKVDVTIAQQYLQYLQEAFLAKLVAIHIINAPSFMDKILMIIKPFMKLSLMKSLYVHSNNDVLEISRYSEEDFTKLMNESKKNLKSNSEFFKEQAKKIVNESKRPATIKVINQSYGVQGSFKKLEID